MKYIVSRYNHDLSWLKDYTNEAVIYDRSEKPLDDTIVVPNIGSDLYDKLTYIIDNYDNLPDVAVYTKANLFKYISKEEFDQVKDSKIFTPLLTQNHKTYMPVCFYKKRMYYEINNGWFLGSHAVMHEARAYELYRMLGIDRFKYVPFAPGSNYILPRQNILKHSKNYYEKLRAYLDWTVYPGEAQIIERGLYTLWR
jgi:hypothetical protein